MQTLFNRFLSLPVWAHVAVTIVAFMGFQTAKTWLDASYVASQHPVDYASGQTGFDAQQIKGFYAHMQEMQTLGVYVRTQIIDFGFIVAVACLGLCLGTLVARAGRSASWAQKLGLAAAFAALTGACMDALENLVSFVMLAQPQDFADWLAVPYSTFAVAKFALLTIAMMAVLGSLALTTAGRVLKRPAIG